MPPLPALGFDDALFFDPAETASIAGALELLWTGEETQRRLSKAGLARAERWSAVDTVGLYRGLLTP